MIADALAGKRIAVTGATGFLGTALVERLLRSVPGCTLVLLVRPGRRQTAADRVRREILRNDCFNRLREELGDDFEDQMAERIVVIPGDVSSDGLGLDDDGRAILAGCSVVMHSAAAVSFDSPLDAAVEVNLLGPSRVAAAIAESGSAAHLVAVSTAYVAGTRRGDAPEALLPDTPFATEVDWRSEVAAARRARADTDAASREPKKQAGFSKRARSELGAAGTPLLADKAEKLREEWVRDHLVDLGRSRAALLGWPDAYAYTKALGERALLENRGDVPVTIVRPSIIESALAEPRPGWIRGFRMAEPVIISYGRGLLKEFPGIPEGVVDVIPVDLVVAALIAVAAAGPAESGASVYQVASGSRNPLRYRRLVDLVRVWFTEHPLYDPEGQPIVVPEWSFPGRGRVQRQLERATKALTMAEKVMSTLPVRGKQADLTTQFEERRAEADRALGYVQLYGAYTETEALFRVDRLVALWETLDVTDQQAFCFDPAVVDWDRYVHEVHLPSVVEHARVRTTPGRKTGPSREVRGRRAVLSKDRHIAAFDLENTLIASNVVESYAYLATRHLAPGERVRFVARTLREAPGLLALDRRDRGDFLRHFYRRYEGAPAERLRQDAWDLFSGLILTKSFPAGIRRVREHKALGHRTLLITGALDFVVEPLRPLFDDIVCARLGVDAQGRLTGELQQGPPTGEARALVMAEYAAAEGLSLAESVAYADSASDLPMLEAVGHPVAVNPEAKLATIARRRGWHVEHWSKAPGGPRPLLPIGRAPALPRSTSR
ncbi:MAG: alcohol-forming fatty acyl-CoA reductase [Acidimicrobiaceae bacterium]|nr:alcohol-forming fatty acyl-CoA reductase [Acidimicrobiaceae bacterium]